MDGNPESPVPPTPELPGSVDVPSECEITSTALQNCEIPDTAQQECEMSGLTTPEYNLPGFAQTEEESQKGNSPFKQTSTDLETSDKKKEQKRRDLFINKSKSFTPLQNIKKDILNKLNRKMNSNLSVSKVETALTYPKESLPPFDTLENQSPKSTTPSTGEVSDYSVTEADVNDEQFYRQKDGNRSEEIELVPDNALKFVNKKETSNKEESNKTTTGEALDHCATESDFNEGPLLRQKDGNGSEGIELVPDNALNFWNQKEPLKKSRIPTQVKPKPQEKLSPKILFKKSKIPTRVIKVRPINPVKPLKPIELKKSKIPTKVIQVRPINPEKPLKQIELRQSKIPTRIIEERCNTTKKVVKESIFKKSNIPTKVVKVRPITQEKPLKHIELKKSKDRLQSSSPIAEMILKDIEYGEFALPIHINNPEDLLRTSQLPVVVKESESTVTVATLVDVKVSRLPNKLRTLFKKLRRPNRKILKGKDSKEKKVKSSWPTDDIYKKALSGDNGMRSRMPMPIRVTRPGMTYPPLSRIPLAFSRFPNPAKVRKITLLRRVKEAFTKQVAKISWSPKLTFPNMESFFHRIRGSNKVMPVNA